MTCSELGEEDELLEPKMPILVDMNGSINQLINRSIRNEERKNKNKNEVRLRLIFQD